MNRFAKISVVSLLLASPHLIALESDLNQKISIQADAAIFSEEDGATQYLGDVILTQGTINVAADRLTVYSEDGDIYRIVAEGGPATYSQLPEIDGDRVVAKGMTIDYKLSDNVLYLLEQASLIQAGTALRGNTIVYDVAANTLRASGSAGTESERVQVIIPPNQGSDEEDD